jgi:subtilisin-like proprotein convertase family protein
MVTRQFDYGPVRLALASVLLATVASLVDARAGAPPLSHSAQLAALDRIAVLELEAIDRAALLAEDEAAKAEGSAKPERFASPADLELTLADAGTWEPAPGGGWVWRLRIHAPNATELNFGFTHYRLATGATLHIWSEDYDYVEGPYTAADVSHAGDLWTPVVPGERAVLELYEPAGVEPASELVLGRIGRGYRDLFRLQEVSETKAASCNIDAVCPEGNLWRDEIRSVARMTIQGMYLCSGTLVTDVPGSFTPYFLTAYHCEVRSHNASTVVAYWNFQSPVCGMLGGGSLADNQSGSFFRAGRQDNDVCLIELEEDPDPDFGVYFAGWDARTSTAPQGTFSAHHPQGDEKMLTLNDDPLTTISSCILSGPPGTHWQVGDYESGTTEGGSSGSALWDAGTHLIVGYLSGGGAACSSPINDCYGKFAVGFDGASADTRLKDWLDPGNTGTRFAAGSDPGGGGGTIRYEGFTATDSCASGQGNANGAWEPGETIQVAVDLSANSSFSSVQGTLTSQTAGVTVVDGSATWPNLSPGGAVGSNPPHFTIRLGGSVACGSTVQLSLRVTAAEGGPFTFQLSNPVGASLEPNVPMTIADQGSAMSTLQVSQSVSLSDVNVRVQINHTYVGDLMVTLRSPAGTTVTLLNRPACGDNNMNVTFDDSSSFNLQSHCAGTTPWYSGVARPYQALSAFNGQSSAGTWTLTVSDHAAGDGGTLVDWELLTTPALSGVCQTCTGGGPAAHTFMVGGIAHAPGLAGSNWRSKLALLNRSGGSAQVTLSYVRGSGPVVTESVTLANNQLVAWDDVAVTLFGVSADSSGAIKVDSSQPLIVTARTYNASASGTYGQFLPGVEESDALASGQTGVISQLAKNADFRTNIGFVNLGSSSCQVRVTLRSTAGSAVGSQRTVTVPVEGWKQDNDIFQAANAGTHANAYATVEVLTSGCEVWGYGSVVDNRSGDPTTIPIEVE